jgi:ribosomal protein S18 acetylase RimI-like enzyme
MTVTIRLLNESDAEQFHAIRLEALRDHPDAFGASVDDWERRTVDDIAASFRDRWTAPDNFIVGAFDGAALVGTIGFHQHEGAKARHKGTIWGVYLAPGTRGSGLARRLMEDVIARVRRLGDVEAVQLGVAIENTAARMLYQRLGFTPWGIERHAIKLPDRYVDEEWMELSLIEEGE